MDSGTNGDMFADRSLFKDLKPLRGVNMFACRGPGTGVAYGGTVELIAVVGDRRKKVKFENALYIPDLRSHMISMGDFSRKNNARFSMEPDGEAYVKNVKTGEILLQGRYEEGELPYLHWERLAAEGNAARKELKGNLQRWHERLGHIGEKSLKTMCTGIVNGMVCEGGEVKRDCEACAKGKMKSAPHIRKDGSYRAKERLELVHMDLVGDIKPESWGGKRWLYVITDDHSRFSWVYGLKKKSEVEEAFKIWLRKAERETGKKLQAARCDRGGEFQGLQKFCDETGIKLQFTAGYSPESNGVAERMNGVLTTMARCMLHHSNLGARFWGEAANMACYVRNRCVSSALPEGTTPYELWYGKKPSLNHLRVFGCKVQVFIPQQKRQGGKFGARGWSGVFVGYSRDSAAFRVWNREQQRIEEVRDLKFFEEILGVRGEAAEDKEPEESGDWVTLPDVVEVEEIREEVAQRRVEAQEQHAAGEEQRQQRPVRERRGIPPPRLTYDRAGRQQEEVIIGNFAQVEHRDVFAGMAGVDEPQTFHEAMNSENEREWKEAMDSELRSLRENQVWELTDLPKDRRAVGCKWVFKKKRDEKGAVVKYKARLVAKGYSQKEGIDYEETYSPVVRHESLRALVAVAASEGWKIEQMDVTTAFLYGELEEEVYMEQPEGAAIEGTEGQVWRLRRSLYGLKQSPRCWNFKLDEVLKGAGFEQFRSDWGVYRRGEGENVVCMGVYVDDLVLVGPNMRQIEDVKNLLKENFRMTDLGPAKYILGVQLIRSEDGAVKLSQETYAKDVLKRFGMADCKSVVSPLDPNKVLTKEMGPQTEEDRQRMATVPYRQAVGSLMYLMIATRPDIATAVSKVSKFCNDPGEEHWEAVERILRYVAGSVGSGLVYRRGVGTKVWGYCDAEYGGNEETGRSTSGYVFLVGETAVSWATMQQPVVALSSTESEYIGACFAAQHAIWMQDFFYELGFSQETVEVKCDNQSCIKLMKKPGLHKRSKHIRIKWHFLRELVENRDVTFTFVGTRDQAADIMTKAVGGRVVNRCKELMGMG